MLFSTETEILKLFSEEYSKGTENVSFDKGEDVNSAVTVENGAVNLPRVSMSPC